MCFCEVMCTFMMYWLSTKNLIMTVALTFNLMKCLRWTLGAGILDMNINESYWTSGDITSNQSAFRKFCIRDHFQSVHVCSLPSRLKYFGNTKKKHRMLLFRINNMDIRVFLSTRQISIPNASISYGIGSNFEIPVYREDISKSLYVFYEGNLVLLGLSLPFSAEWNGFEFAGRTYIHEFYFKLTCSISESTFYIRNRCLYCRAMCTNTELKNNQTLSDHQDVLETYYEHPGFDYSQIFSTEKQPFRKRKSAATFPPTPLSCVLHLVADHLFFKYIGDGRVIKALNVMFSVVNGADAIFRSTDFDGDGQGDNIGFLIGKVTIFPDSHDPNYILTHPYLVANNYLKMFSHYDFGGYCLGLAFTYRDFKGLAGSAFQAYSEESLPGGICQVRLKHNFQMISYNTAVTTFLNYGRRLKVSRVVLILAHEMGHAFGANHDVTTECLPKMEGGHFLMSATIKFGELPNNPRYSACSIRAMLPVIRKKGYCLVVSDHISQCGNTIPEIGEECDCGTRSICHLVDPCCTPADVEEHEDKPCTVQRSKGKLCSPMVNPCCTHSCTYVPSSERKVCNQLYDCSYLSFCDGLSSHCPFSGHLPNGTLCNHGFQVCNGGTCSRGVCEYYNLTNCVCTDHDNQCKLCCRDPWTLACEPASSYGISNISGYDIHHEPGEQCYNDGFCDLSLKCQGAYSVFSTTSVLGFKTLAELEIHVRNYWLYYVFTTFCLVFTITVLLLPYRLHDNNHMKTLRYGKLLAVFATGEHQTKIYTQTLADIDDHYTCAILRLHSGCEPMDLTEALGRLKVFFPEARTAFLSRVAKLSAAESTAVKILLLQGFKMRTFTKSKATSQ